MPKYIKFGINGVTYTSIAGIIFTVSVLLPRAAGMPLWSLWLLAILVLTALTGFVSRIKAMPMVFKLGIAAGIYAAIVGITCAVAFSLPGIVGPQPPWYLLIETTAAIAGIISAIAIVHRDKRPRLAFILIWLSFAAILSNFILLGPLGYGLFEFPAMVLLLPAAVRIRWPDIRTPLMLGVLGVLWAIVPKYFIGISQLYYRPFSVVSVIEIIFGVICLIAIIQQPRNRRFSFQLLLIGIGGITAICFPLTPDPLGIFETLPAAILLVPITCKIASELQFVAENTDNRVQVVA